MPWACMLSWACRMGPSLPWTCARTRQFADRVAHASEVGAGVAPLAPEAVALRALGGLVGLPALREGPSLLCLRQQGFQVRHLPVVYELPGRLLLDRRDALPPLQNVLQGYLLL